MVIIITKNGLNNYERNEFSDDYEAASFLEWLEENGYYYSVEEV